MLLASTSSPVAIRASTSVSGTRSIDIAASSALTAPRGARLELGGEEQVGVLVAEAGRVVELAEQLEPAGVVPDLLLELAVRGHRGGLARRRRACRRAPRAARGRRRRATGARAIASSSITGTTTTAPGWWTTCRSNSSPSGSGRARATPTGSRRRGAARSRRPGTRGWSVTRLLAGRVVDRQRQARQTTLGPVAGRLHERGEQRVRAVGAALELGVGLGADEERVTRQLDELDQAVVGRGARADQPRLLEPAAVLVVHLVAVPVALVDDFLAVRGLHDRARQQLRRVRAEAHGAALVDDVALRRP